MSDLFEPLLSEVSSANIPNITNIPKSNDVMEVCTSECCAEETCTCNKQKCKDCKDCEDFENCKNCEDNETNTEPDYVTLDKEIKEMQAELDKKLKIKKEYETQQKLKEEQERKRIEEEKKRIERTELVNKINAVVKLYNEQKLKCEEALKTYNLESAKSSSLSSEYYSLIYKLNSIDNKPNSYGDYNYMDNILKTIFLI
jgi:hypothetical protein